jgi:hypothetical protein
MKIEHWFTGVVENIADPLNAGRVQIRCFEYHEQNNIILPSENLPWAMPIMPLTSASLRGIGTSSTGLRVGSWVFGFFRDADLQDLVIINSIGGIVPNSVSSGGNTSSNSVSSTTRSTNANAIGPSGTNPSPTKTVTGIDVQYDEFLNNTTNASDIGNRSPVGGDEEPSLLPPLPGTPEADAIDVLPPLDL